MTDVARVTVPYCGACGYDVTSYGRNVNDDELCDSCGADLARFGFAGLFPPADLAAATGTDEVTFTFTAALDTQDVLYQIDDGDAVFDDDVSSPYDVAAPAVAKVSLAVRTVLNGVAGPWSTIVSGSSGQAPPVITAVAGSLEVSFTFTADPAADTTDLFYTIDAAGDTTVEGVASGVAVVAAEGEVVEGQLRSVQDGVAGIYGTADSETALA